MVNSRRKFIGMAIGTVLAATLPLGSIFAAGSGVIPPTRTRGTTVRNVRNYGAVGDGVHDDTAAFNRAIASLPSSGGTVTVPAGTYMIDPYRNGAYGINLRSYMLLLMDPAAILRSRTSSHSHTRVINIPNGTTQVEIAGGRLEGERATHIYMSTSTDEWNHGIMVGGATHVTIRDLWVGNFTGDGMSTGGGTNDLVVSNIVSTNNRRQGLSITHAYNVKVYDSEFSYTNGTAPQHGIDVEPDSPYTCTDVLIQNCNLHHNAGVGIEVHQRVSRCTIKNNLMEYNVYGVYTGSSDDHGEISGNTIQHNIWAGVYLASGTTYYSAFNNTFANNHTKTQGIKLNLGTPVAKTGFVSPDMTGSRGTGTTVGTNYYRSAT